MPHRITAPGAPDNLGRRFFAHSCGQLPEAAPVAPCTNSTEEHGLHLAIVHIEIIGATRAERPTTYSRPSRELLLLSISTVNHHSLSSFIWSVADLLRGDYKQSDYGKVILPFTVLRRLDWVLEATKAKVLAEFAAKQKAGLNPDLFLLRASDLSFYNTSPMDMGKLMGDQDPLKRPKQSQKFWNGVGRQTVVT